MYTWWREWLIRFTSRLRPGLRKATKVMKEVGTHLNVRVHEVKALKSGGAIIRTSSVADREKVANNAKFKEAGC